MQIFIEWTYFRFLLKNSANLSHGMRFLGSPFPSGSVKPPSYRSQWVAPGMISNYLFSGQGLGATTVL